MKNYALISAWEKEGIESLARSFVAMGMNLLATGGSLKYLREKGLEVLDVSDLTGEPERFGGRLKTLHHKILGGILFRPGQDEGEWPFDFRISAVVCNFYPFEEKAKDITQLPKLIEWIDIGGPNMVRAAAKNYEHVWVFTKPSQYLRFISSPEPGLSLRSRFALEAFEECADYNQVVADEVLRIQLKNSTWSTENGTRESSELKYGENPQQKAKFIPNRKLSPKFLGDWSFNNIRDAEGALRFVRAWSHPAVSVVKHQTLCGASLCPVVTTDEKLLTACFESAWEGDTVSRFGGVIALNFEPTAAMKEIFETKFIEVLVLPNVGKTEEWAADLVRKKPRLKILLLEKNVFGDRARHTGEVITGILGRLEQEADSLWQEGEDPNAHFTEDQLFDRFGIWTAACSKSNAITLCVKEPTVLCGKENKIFALAGSGQGQPNRVDSLEKLALPRAKDWSERRKVSFSKLVCFSDGFLPFDDVLKILAKAGIKKIIQPGGSKNDPENEKTAHSLGLDMQIVPPRHFWH